MNRLSSTCRVLLVALMLVVGTASFSSRALAQAPPAPPASGQCATGTTPTPNPAGSGAAASAPPAEAAGPSAPEDPASAEAGATDAESETCSCAAGEAITATDRENAKQLYRKGNALRKIGDCEGAVHYYLRSREILPSLSNTTNAAYCLNKLERYDEALTLYEALLFDYKDKLSPSQAAEIGPLLDQLRERTARLSVTSNVGAELVVDGRHRGTLPLPGSVWLLPGERHIRVVKEGYDGLDRKIQVEPRQSLDLDVQLAPLRHRGALRVAVEGGAQVDLLVDGVKLGVTPWEGSLAPGPHLVQALGEQHGSVPADVTVVEGHRVDRSLQLIPLGAPIRLEVVPDGADIAINGVSMRSSRYAGRLPVGLYTVEARDEGYFPEKRVFKITARTPLEQTIELRPDPRHPRWEGKEPNRYSVELLMGLALGGGFGDTYSSCSNGLSCSDRELPFGAHAAGRFSIDLPSRFSISFSGGYLALATELSRGFTSRNVDYVLADKISIKAPYLTIGGGYAHTVDQLTLGARLQAGVFFESTRHGTEARLERGAQSVTGVVQGTDESQSQVTPLLWPEIYVQYLTGNLLFGVGVGVPMFIGGPGASDQGEILPDPAAPCDMGDEPGCAAASERISGESTHGFAVFIAPSISLGYRL